MALTTLVSGKEWGIWLTQNSDNMKEISGPFNFMLNGLKPSPLWCSAAVAGWNMNVPCCGGMMLAVVDSLSVPHPNLYILVNPVKVTLDFLTLLWSQYFFFTLAQSVVSVQQPLFLHSFLSFFKIWYWNARPKWSMVPASPNFTEAIPKGLTFGLCLYLLCL